MFHPRVTFIVFILPVSPAGSPVEVEVTMFIVDISSVSEVLMVRKKKGTSTQTHVNCKSNLHQAKGRVREGREREKKAETKSITMLTLRARESQLFCFPCVIDEMIRLIHSSYPLFTSSWILYFEGALTKHREWRTRPCNVKKSFVLKREVRWVSSSN